MITVQRAMDQGKKRAPVEKSHKQWRARWDKKCKAPFADYVPPTNARLT